MALLVCKAEGRNNLRMCLVRQNLEMEISIKDLVHLLAWLIDFEGEAGGFSL